MKRTNVVAIAVSVISLSNVAFGEEVERNTDKQQKQANPAKENKADPALLSPTQSGIIQDVTITSERRKTPLLKTPAAVSAIGPSQIQGQNLQILKDLEGKIPAFATPGAIANMQSIYIRGIGTGDAGTYPAVGQYVDDVYLPRVFGNSIFDLPDLERIEVLRGPQATLYGQNTTAGVVKLISRDPSQDTVAHVDASYGSFNAFQAHLYAATPLGEGVSASVAYGHRQASGWIHDYALGRDVNRVNTDQFRAKLRLSPSSNLDAILTIDGAQDTSDNATFLPTYSNLAPLAGKLTNFALPTTPTPGNLQLGRHSGGVSLRLTYVPDEHWTIKSISAGRFLTDSPSPWDYDSTPSTINDFTQWINERYFYQELQSIAAYGPLTVTSGATFFTENFRFGRVSGTTSGNTVKYSEVRSNIADQSISLYAQANYKFTEEFGVTLGVRGSREWQTYGNAGYTDNALGVPTAVVYTLQGQKNAWNGVTPKISFDYQWTPDLLTYVSFTQGQRTGGYNRSASTAAIAALPTKPEKVSTYELGAKFKTLDGRSHTTVAVFYNDFRDYIASVTNPVVNGVPVTGSVFVNAGAAHTFGVEFEEKLWPTTDLEIRFNGALIKSAFDTFVNPTGAANSNYTGNRVPFVSTAQFGGSVEYTLPVDLPGQLKANAYAKYISPFYSDIANTLPFRVGEQFYVGLGANYQPNNEPWSVFVRVTNLLNNQPRVLTNGYQPSRGEYEVTYAPPLQVSGGLAWEF
ncbi:MAG: hypothetical protein C3F11_12040 [Methylocystaceae bacterium]|nr:MAG: hypothetical protein C3F11_12040 [Methylocystaceae bacterium]